MKKQYFILLSSFFLSLLFFALSGCSTTKSVVDKIVPGAPDLKKRVMIAPLVDQAEFGRERTAQIAANFVELLKESPHLLLFQDPQGIPSGTGSKSPEFGIVIPPELVKRAQDLGMNALIIGVLNPLEATTRKTGIWPFRDMSRIIEISMTVNIVDTTSGCLYLTELDSEEMDFLIDELPGRDENEVIDQIIEAKMPRILKHQSAAVIKSLVKKPWTGKILAVENGMIRINGGKDVGVRPDQLFTVFARGESITCRAGRSFDILGKKIGEIKTTSIMEKHSLAVPVAEGSFLAGQTIRAVGD
ncbi:MAG: hypothetical protein L6406_09700 [Desulfobacterales bacterium]|nr:hypothetical protein [Desulfobacterales bacterium]